MRCLFTRMGYRMPFHFAEASANKLTNSAFHDVTKTGEYKVAAARVAKSNNMGA